MGDLTSPPADVISIACRFAVTSPCAKSKRGAALFNARTLRAISAGCNGPAGDRSCDGSEACRASCSRRCAHAEQRALRYAYAVSDDRGDLELVHVKVVDGRLVAGGPPSCWQCSREVLEARIAAVWLYQDAGGGQFWRRWEAAEFDAASRSSGIVDTVY